MSNFLSYHESMELVSLGYPQKKTKYVWIKRPSRSLRRVKKRNVGSSELRGDAPDLIDLQEECGRLNWMAEGYAVGLEGCGRSYRVTLSSPIMPTLVFDTSSETSAWAIVWQCRKFIEVSKTIDPQFRLVKWSIHKDHVVPLADSVIHKIQGQRRIQCPTQPRIWCRIQPIKK